jgi:chromosome partitioning protein
VKSILVTSPKGGCGKTTIATNLAAAFAAWGLETALADTDPQRSSLDWLKDRPKSAAAIRGLDWTKGVKKVPKGISRLVIDSAASMSIREVRALVKVADIVIIPVLPSAFDLKATLHFLQNFRDLKPIRKGKKPFALIRNRARSESRAAKRFEERLAGLDTTTIGSLSERSLYNDVAWDGISVFDLTSQKSIELQQDWIPIVRFIESRDDS